MTQELGSSCSDPCECASGSCFEVSPFGGVCSQCDSDDDCAEITGFGCNFGNPLSGTPAICGTGSPGDGCETDGACVDGLSCAQLIEIPGIFSVSTCSECVDDTDCMGASLCAPSYDLASIGGLHSCVSPASVPNDEGCSVTGDGTECISGNCALADLMGIPVIGVCSPCNEDSDCMGGQMCSLPEVAVDADMLVLVPGACM